MAKLFVYAIVAIMLYAGYIYYTENRIPFVDKQVNHVGQTISKYSAEAKANLQKELNEQISDFNKDIDDLKSRAERADNQMKAEISAQINEIETEKKDLETKIEKLDKQTGQAWEDLSEGAREAARKIKESTQKARNRF